jgi:hypothetical protein
MWLRRLCPIVSTLSALSCDAPKSTEPTTHEPSPVEKLAQGFLNDAARDDDAASYAKLCRGYSAGVPQSSVGKALRANAYLHASPSFGVYKRQSYQGGWSLEGAVKTNVGSVGLEVYGGTEAQDAPCISGIVIGGTPVLPIPGACTEDYVRDGGR